ncbi:hypothetical protein ACLOJK_008296 [Asimina triloba]
MGIEIPNLSLSKEGENPCRTQAKAQRYAMQCNTRAWLLHFPQDMFTASNPID